MPDAVVIGAGPNGLVAANMLVDRGWGVTVLEAAHHPGGAVRSSELIEPGFVNDMFSAFYPFAAVSPAITRCRVWRLTPRSVAISPIVRRPKAGRISSAKKTPG